MKYIHLILISLLFIQCNHEEKQQEIIPQQQEIDPNSIEAIEQEILDNPESPNVYLKRADYFARKAEFGKAIDDINRALTITPDVTEINFQKAELLFNKAGKDINPLLYDQAEIYLNKTLELDSTNTNADILMAKIKIIKKEDDLALKYLNDALRISPTLSEPYLLKGILYLDHGNLQLAQSSLQTAVEMDATSYDANAELGYIYTLDTNETGLIYLDAAAQIDTTMIEPWRNKGLLLRNLGRPKEAIKSFQHILQIDSTFEEAYYNIGVCYIDSYRDNAPQQVRDTIVRGAINYFKKAVELNPDYVLALYNLGYSYEFSGNRDSALIYYKRAIDIEPDFELVNEALRRF